MILPLCFWYCQFFQAMLSILMILIDVNVDVEINIDIVFIIFDCLCLKILHIHEKYFLLVSLCFSCLCYRILDTTFWPHSAGVFDPAILLFFLFLLLLFFTRKNPTYAQTIIKVFARNTVYCCESMLFLFAVFEVKRKIRKSPWWISTTKSSMFSW